MKPAAVTFCSRCQKGFVAYIQFVPVEPAEPWKSAADGVTLDDNDVDELDEDLTTCPRCGGETQVLQLSPDMRAVLRDRPDRGLA